MIWCFFGFGGSRALGVLCFVVVWCVRLGIFAYRVKASCLKVPPLLHGGGYILIVILCVLRCILNSGRGPDAQFRFVTRWPFSCTARCGVEEPGRPKAVPIIRL